MGKVAIVINVKREVRPSLFSKIPRAQIQISLCGFAFRRSERSAFFADLGSASQIAVAPALSPLPGPRHR